MKKALALFSGGLDSMISMKLLKDQGIEVIALHFNIGFGANRDKLEYLKNATAQVGVELKVCDIREQFFNEILFTPKYGYGKFFNPCIDCHANMFTHAFYKLLELNADFVISGEVIGQRPKSQRREALDQVKKIIREIGKNSAFDTVVSRDGSDTSKPSFLDELILRPMSAKLLEPTFPEKAGWVDRERLLDVSGRGRNTQLSMVEQFGWKYYEKPGGGCLLTDTSVSLKLKDLSSHRKMVIEDSTMVKIGRYMVLENGARCVIARNDEENHKLDNPHPLMDKIELLDCVGPIGLVEKSASQEDRILAGRITLSYGKSEISQSYRVKIGEEEKELFPYDKEEIRKFLFLK
ncbi:argininosuccinate synthase domain-containing protein [Helicobacter cappadocius]|uniref:7-cyano-7-deazaguanine synthase n=1 Tax=Helicobacter cappadocius TaxID=3063998 RepID=A0AA90PKB7_9HELI|nr:MULTISPECIES: argininosuccinate synthase domain-containing protein [unclassified Helicobacter]MDO7253140.1 7-cyano-7-deazaguanine synthase [Helicobacter sp. faydin-H75]MDP2538734.1 7-cyano-7-deazaguanine synthase [Helicobacter sp. faydin-H76]